MSERPGRIPLKGLLNTRDLGGYRGAGKRKIKRGRLIRSGALFKAQPEDLKLLTEIYRLGTVIDFRTEAERSQRPDPPIPGVQMIFLPVLTEETVGITFEGGGRKDPLESFLDHAVSLRGRPEIYVDQLYRNLAMDGHAITQYAKFLQILLESDDRAVLWHCTAGKDRAGIGTALVLTALGVDRETVMADYTATNEYRRESTDRMIEALSKKCSDPSVLSCARVLSGVSERYLKDAFCAMEAAEGSVERYLENRLGLTGPKRGLLRDKYLE